MRLIRLIVVGLVAVGACVGVAGAASLGTNNVYGTSSGLPAGAMLGQGKAGADGNFWFLDNNKGTAPFGNKAVGEIDSTTHAISEYSLPNGIPRFLGAGPDGNLWVSVVTAPAAAVVPAIDQVVPNGTLPPTINVFGTRPGSRPNQLGKGPDGNLWFTDSGSPKAVGVLCLTTSPLCSSTDVASDASHEYSGGTACTSTVPVCSGSLYVGSTPRFIGAGPDGNVWFTDNGTTPAIGEVNTTTGTVTEWSIALNGGSAGRSPGTIAAGPDGNLWFADAVAASPAIGEFNLTTNTVTEYGVGDGLQVGSLVNGAMEAPDGNMWFTDSSTTVGDAPIEVICLTVSSACTNADVATRAIHEFPVVTYPASIGNSGGIGSDGNLWWIDLSTTATPGGEAIGQFSLGVCGGDSLAGCDLRGVNLENVSLDGANLQGSNLSRAELGNASLVGANLQGSNLSGVQLQSYAQLSYANLQGANLNGANLAGANLTGANLAGANLRGDDLTGARLADANLGGANVHAVIWAGTTCPDGSNSDDDGGTCLGHGVS